jgi:hypothetical protein
MQHLILPAVEFSAVDRGSWFSILLRERAHPEIMNRCWKINQIHPLG